MYYLYGVDRKKYGNEKTFKRLIKELNSLRKKGIVLDNGAKVYLLPVLIVGDNLGLNIVLGFSANFARSRFCRICYVHPATVQFLTYEEKYLLRTLEEYEKDISHIDTIRTGVQENCAFNKLEGYHVLINRSCDIMHDILEGFGKQIMSLLILHFIKSDFFTIAELNARVQNFDFVDDPRPPPIGYNYLMHNETLKMSASETSSLIKYFGVLIGDIIPRGDNYYNLFKQFRTLYDYVFAPTIKISNLKAIESLISQNLKIFKGLFGRLIAKFHLLLHYIRLIKQNGPLSNSSGMRYESKHKECRAVAQATNSRKNLLKTVAIRLQLNTAFFQLNVFKKSDIFTGI